MTTMQIEIVGRRALDVLVAEHVMGWERGVLMEGTDEASAVWYPRGKEAGGWCEETDMPCYSLGNDAAMKVVAALIARDLDVHLSYVKEYGWECRIETQPKKGDRHKMRQLWTHFDESLPRAICIAALRQSGKAEDVE